MIKSYLSNTSPVIHVHIIPRYKEPQLFAGITFDDLRFGKHYAPYDRSFVLEETVLFAIRDAIQQKILLNKTIS